VDPLAELGIRLGSGGRGIGSGSGKLTDRGEAIEAIGRGGRLSGLLEDGPGVLSMGINIELGLDCVGYRKGKGAKAASILASDSARRAKSSGSTNIENLEDARREGPATDDLEFRRDAILADNR
jgi:hypothetical protein